MIGIFLCAEDGVEVYPRQGKSIFPHQKYRLPVWVVGIFLFREDRVEVYPRQGKSIFPHQKYQLPFWGDWYFSFSLFTHSLLFPFETCRFRESVIVNTHRKRILQRHRNARQMHGAEKNLDRLRQHREEKPHMIRPPTPWAGFCCSAPSRSRCAQARGQLPPRQAAHERVKAIGAHRQPAVRARPQVRIFPRRQRRKTHLASPHLHSSLPAAKLLCIWITFALSLYSLE